MFSNHFLTERDDNITFSIESGGNANPFKGTWLAYEMLPEILRLISIDFRILANRYESLLLPYLTDKNESFESHVNWLNKQSLIKSEIVDELKTIPEPFIKGSKSEKYIMDLLGEVFEQVGHVGNRKHRCDIYLENEDIYVEVKCRKDTVRHDYEKFKRDLCERKATLGVYVNILHDEETRVEVNPFCFYLSVNDFTKDMLMMIKRTAERIHTIRESGLNANKYLEHVIFDKTVTDAAVERMTVSLENIINMTCARLKNKFAIADCVTYDNNEPVPVIDEDTLAATKSFFAANIDRIKKGVHAQAFVKEYKNFMDRVGLESLKEQEFRDFMKQYCRVGRQNESIDGEIKSVNAFILTVDPKFTADDKYRPLFDKDLLDNQENEVKEATPAPSSEELVTEYINYHDVKERLMNGYSTDAFKNAFDNFTTKKYGVKVTDYKTHLLKHCIQAYVDNKKTKFILNDSKLAHEILDDADAFLAQLSDNQFKNVTELLNSYRDWCKNKPQLTKESFQQLMK